MLQYQQIATIFHKEIINNLLIDSPFIYMIYKEIEYMDHSMVGPFLRSTVTATLLIIFSERKYQFLSLRGYFSRKEKLDEK